MDLSRSQLLSRGQAFFLVGGAGFIGSHFTDALLGNPDVKQVTIYDNFSSGKEWHYEHHVGDRRLSVICGDVTDSQRLKRAMSGHDVVIHLASNPDIARAATEPAVDFEQGTVLTHRVLEAMRGSDPKRILYASGSGVYGDLGEIEAHEDYGPLQPISTYGASKLAGEVLISSYCHMFGLIGIVFRFGNVVGPRQTHGVGFDFVRRLMADPSQLRILGDGTQSKSYIHVDDVVRAVLLGHVKTADRFQTYNVATKDYVTVQEIAELAIECLGYSTDQVTMNFTGGKRGWAGDVPIVRLNTQRIRRLGWSSERNAREALRASLLTMINEPRIATIETVPSVF